MFQLRRYAVYFGLAACVLITLNFFKEGLVKSPQTHYGPQSTLTQDDRTKLQSDGFSWDKVPVRFPVKSLTPLPTAQPRKLPKVQHDFLPESDAQKITRLERKGAVRSAFERSWNAYKKHAWMHDELTPLTGSYKDGFGGWGASLVDNLDLLWIMGMKEEFDKAVSAAIKIDLSKVTLRQINVFETTIRHLGGFLSAYDLSGDERCLSKAREFGDMLIVAFDTPHRMPITRWDPRMAFEAPQQADQTVLLAEIGSLTMEFTRLSQLTGDPKWYDAVERIVKLLADQQNETQLPGMWPVVVDAKNMDFKHDTFYSLSAMADSLYEYFPKMYALLGGVEDVYRKLYDGSMATAIKYVLWRPMTPDNADILISGNVRTTRGEAPLLDPQGQHLACFTGGMFALGGKLFNEPAHVEIGKKLTNGCIWAYKNMPLGIMPEIFAMVPCSDRNDCHWDEKRWVASLAGDDAKELVKEGRQPPGFTDIADRRYILRPEAVESIFILYRITGERYLLEAAWTMFTAITNATETDFAYAALGDITYSREKLVAAGATMQVDSMESFWMAETLKYFYLIFSETNVIDLDEWVFNTEAHPFKRALPQHLQ